MVNYGFLEKCEKDYRTGTGTQREASGIERCTVSENEILKIEFLKVNGFNVKLKDLWKCLCKG